MDAGGHADCSRVVMADVVMADVVMADVVIV